MLLHQTVALQRHEVRADGVVREAQGPGEPGYGVMMTAKQRDNAPTSTREETLIPTARTHIPNHSPRR